MGINGIHRIGVISDTHDLIRPSVTEYLKECEAILHAGDISSRAILNEFQQIAPVYAVRGNADEAWGMDLPVFIDSSVCGIRFYMTHKKKDLPSSLEGYDLVICGHSHRYEERKEGDITFLNPGSCGPRRFIQAVTMAVVDISDKGISIVRVDLPHTAKEADSIKKQGIDMQALVTRVMKETDKGHSVKSIAEKTGMEPSLIEQIVRLYLTHPGVTADGILGKMGL